VEVEEECEDLPPGLYAFPTCRTDTYAPGIRRYKPKFELWSDGATKERFIYLPPGSTIDTRNPDRWAFPVGTRIYKQFNVNGLKIETRVMIKEEAPASIDSWSMVSWAWNAEQDRAEPVNADPAVGRPNALGTQHDIPSMNQCKSCHTMVGPDPMDMTKTVPLDAVNGFGAIQLNHPTASFTLQELLERQLLVDEQRGGANVSTTNAVVPGDQDAVAALGYLHANCGHCHGGSAPKANLLLWTTVGHSSVTETPVFADVDATKPATSGSGAVCECLSSYISNLPDRTAYAWRLNAGHPELSAVVARMSVRNSAPDATPVISRQQMPPLGTERVDELGLKQVTRWIKSLDAVACESKTCTQPAPRPPAMMPAAAGAPAPAPTTP
jgi:hypothetical protein